MLRTRCVNHPELLAIFETEDGEGLCHECAYVENGSALVSLDDRSDEEQEAARDLDPNDPYRDISEHTHEDGEGGIVTHKHIGGSVWHGHEGLKASRSQPPQGQ